jgi:competence protein ComGC
MKGSTELGRLFADSHARTTQSCEGSGPYAAMENGRYTEPECGREVFMRSIGGIVALLVGVLVGLFVYRGYIKQSQVTGAATPEQTINVVGIKNDLLSIAQAERAYQAEHSSIASLDELVSSGELSMKKSGRDGYTYQIEPSGEGFRVIAHCPPVVAGCTNYAVDQTMEVRAEP